MKRLFLSLFLILGTFSASFAASNATDIYLLAQTKSTSELGKVEDIDAVDADGNTALCSAIKDNNIDAYNLLKKAGANTEHKCVKKIPAKQYQAFTQKLAATNKSWSFLGMGKWAWTAIGVGVAGGAAAAGMGGGGGSGGDGSGDNPLSHYTPQFNKWLQQGFQYEPCQSGYYAQVTVWDWSGIPGESEKIYMYQCEVNYCSYNTTECTEGYIETGETCQSGETLYKRCVQNTCNGYNYTNAMNCPAGYTTGSSCLSGTTMRYKCDMPQPCPGYDYTDAAQCPAGYTTGSSCLSGSTTKYKCDQYTLCDYTTTECTGGYVETGNTCQSGETLYKECTPRTCSYNTTSCAAGYHETGNTCQSGETTYVECEINTCEGYDYTAGDTCPNGWTMYSSCLSGTTMKYMCDAPAMCPYDTTTCTTGYHETGATCQSGDVLYKECEADVCEGYNYTNASECPAGYTTGSSCLSGSTMKYMCDELIQCPYNTQSCGAGYTETGNTCQSGTDVYVECEPVTCPYDTTSCISGYHETGNTCQSEETIYKECEADACDGYNYTNVSECPLGYTVSDSCLSGNVTKYKCETPVTCPYSTTECTGGYVETGNTCQSGETIYVECEPIQCGVHSVWSESGCTCENGYQNWTSGVGCYPVSCGVNATQVGAECYCNPGYNQWTLGYGCYQTQDCGINATQSGNNCICDTGYTEWTQGYGCYPIQNCGVNATQSGGNCICDSGYQDWTSGYGCYPIIDCGQNAHQNGPNCECNTGYENWTNGEGCTLIILDCGASAHQNGTQCECDSGYSNWQDGIGCTLYGATPTTSFINNTTISLTNTSDSAVYGVYTDKLVKNVYIKKTGTTSSYYDVGTYPSGYPYTAMNEYQGGTVQITNTGENDVYGIYSNGGVNSSSVAMATSDNYIYNATMVAYALNITVTATGTVKINNHGNGNIYGFYSISSGGYNADAGSGDSSGITSKTAKAISNGTIDITNHGNGDIYGTYNITKNANARVEEVTYTINDSSYTKSDARGTITINNTGNGNVYGMYGATVNSYASGKSNKSTGNINIINSGYGNVYGIYGNAKNAESTVTGNDYVTNGIIDITNIGDGNVYGIYGNSTAQNATGTAIGQLTISNNGIGNSYGLYTPSGTVTNDGADGSYIKMLNYSSGNSYSLYSSYRSNNYKSIINQNMLDGLSVGVYAGNMATNSNTGVVTINNNESGTAIGMYGNSGTVTNAGVININNIGTGTAIGIFGNNNSTINNSGTINITRDEYTDDDDITYVPTSESGSSVYGIYAKPGSTINNSGSIDITSNSSMFGIYAETGSTITNTGTITLNGISCTGGACLDSIPYIVLNDATLYNSGVMAAPQMNLNMMGGNVIAGLGSQFVVENELSGNLNISSELVQSGNQTTYIAENMIDAGDVSGLNVRSASAMFNASLADNGHDVVMQMKDFNELTDNASLAAFLANNYANGKGSDLFATLKSMENISAFNGTLSGLTGLNTFTQFAHEDLSAMREISFSMNNKLFENSSRDSFDISDSTGYFSFSNDHNGGSGRYGISNDKISDNWKLGYGMAMANINTGDGDSMHRQNNLWLFYMPATYTNDDIELVIAPKAGFAHSEYNRRGYNNINYEGYIEKRIFGLMNDLRYPLTFGNWTFAPDLAFNAIVYDQSGHEDEQEFSLVIPDDRTISVETGLGFYTKYEKQLSDGSKFKLNSGLMLYREFGDTYDIKLGIRGMDGTFSLYNNDYEYRGAASLGFDYTTGHLHLYGNAQYFMDNANYMNFKGGISYRF